MREPAIFEGFPTAWQGWPQQPEVSAVVAHGGKYYAIVASSLPFTHILQHVLVSDSPYGPFHPAKKNSRYLVTNNSYFSRFVHTPDGVLVNHQSWEAPPDGVGIIDYGVNAKTGHLSPLKRADWDEEGTMRLKWWDGNDKAKARAVPLESPLIETKFDKGETLILEGEMLLSSYYSGLYLQGSGDSGTAIKVHKNGIVEYGNFFGPDGTFDIRGYVDRELRLSDSVRFRLVRKGRMTEFYLNDYLMQIYSPPEFGTGRIGLMGPVEKFSDLRAWYCS